MNIYERNGQYLVVVGDIPQWLIVDAFGLAIAQKIIDGVTVDEIVVAFDDEQTEDVQAVYDELLPLLTQTVDRTVPVIENALTSRTTVAMISVTRDCNLKNICPHCYVDACGSRDKDLSIEEHRRLAAQLRAGLASDNRRVYKINLTGGEPFVRKDIVEIIRVYREVGFVVNMSTNALMISDADMIALKELEVTLSISLDGSSPQTHDTIRGRGSWSRLVSKIERLVNVGVRVGINFLVHSGNFDDLEKTIALAHDLGCSGFNPINLVQLGRACSSKLRRVPEVELFKRLAVFLRDNPEYQPLFANSSLFSSLGAALLAGITCESCGVGNRPCVYVDEIGRIYPCPNTQRDEFQLGDFRSDRLDEYLRLDHPVMRRLRDLQIDTLNPTCAACDVRYFCGGDCRGETYNVTGDLRAPYVACLDRHDSIIELMWIVGELSGLFEERADEYITNLH